MKQALHGEIVQDVRVFWGKSSGKTQPQRKQIHSLVVKTKRVSGLPVKDDILVKGLIRVSELSFITDLPGVPRQISSPFPGFHLSLFQRKMVLMISIPRTFPAHSIYLQNLFPFTSWPMNRTCAWQLTTPGKEGNEKSTKWVKNDPLVKSQGVFFNKQTMNRIFHK